jgi:hypothetical protein
MYREEARAQRKRDAREGWSGLGRGRPPFGEGSTRLDGSIQSRWRLHYGSKASFPISLCDRTVKQAERKRQDRIPPMTSVLSSLNLGRARSKERISVGQTKLLVDKQDRSACAPRRGRAAMGMGKEG